MQINYGKQREKRFVGNGMGINTSINLCTFISKVKF